MCRFDKFFLNQRTYTEERIIFLFYKEFGLGIEKHNTRASIDVGAINIVLFVDPSGQCHKL